MSFQLYSIANSQNKSIYYRPYPKEQREEDERNALKRGDGNIITFLVLKISEYKSN